MVVTHLVTVNVISGTSPASLKEATRRSCQLLSSPPRAFFSLHAIALDSLPWGRTEGTGSRDLGFGLRKRETKAQTWGSGPSPAFSDSVLGPEELISETAKVACCSPTLYCSLFVGLPRGTSWERCNWAKAQVRVPGHIDSSRAPVFTHDIYLDKGVHDAFIPLIT